MAAAAFGFEQTDSIFGARLEVHDIERELKRMKTTLALIDLRRQLMDPTIDGRAALRIAESIIAIQRDA